MKKIHVLIPTIATISFMPLVGLVGCGKDELTELCFENDNNDDKVSNIQYEAHLVTNSDRDIEYKYDNGK